MGMNALQQASQEIREQFKAGENVVFGAHVDEKMGERSQMIVLGATDLEAGMVADVAPVAEQVVEANPSALKSTHESKLKASSKPMETKKTSKKSRFSRKKESEDQNTFDFIMTK